MRTSSIHEWARNTRAGGRARRWLRGLGAGLALACVGCASPPPVHLHTLTPSERPVPRQGGMPAEALGPAVELEPIRVPAQVDQPQWLIRLPDDTLALLEQERWAAPLAEEFHQALLEILRLRFGAVDTRTIAPGAPLWRVRVDVNRFESAPGEARLETTWALTPRSVTAPTLRCTSYFREGAGSGMPALAEAHRRALARLGEVIGEQLLALQRGEPGRCPLV